MRKIFISAFFYLFIILLFSAFYFLFEPNYIDLTHNIIDKVSHRLEKRHNITRNGEGGSYMTCVNNIAIMFKCSRPLSRSQARELVIDCSKELLQEINQNQKIRPYLSQYPFEPRNIYIGIIIDSQGCEIYLPEICDVNFSGGKICYSTQVLNKYAYATRETETYEEALKKHESELCEIPPRSNP